MFVEKEEAESDGYREFWEALRRGECQRAQFRRINKTGNEVWLEAAYNPILDARGQLAAVLKFAYDITETYNQATSKISKKQPSWKLPSRNHGTQKSTARHTGGIAKDVNSSY